MSQCDKFIPPEPTVTWEIVPGNAILFRAHLPGKSDKFYTEDGDFNPNYAMPFARLWWSGARWIAWVGSILICVETEFTDVSDPPFAWAEALYDFTKS